MGTPTSLDRPPQPNRSLSVFFFLTGDGQQYNDMAKKKTLSRQELKDKLIDGIEEMHKIVSSEESTPNQKGYAANTLSGMVKQYVETFGEELEDEYKMRSVKNF